MQQLEDGSLNQNTFAVLPWRINEKLKKEWVKYKSDVNELKWIISAIENKFSMLDPNKFVNMPIAYVDHAKTCFFLEANNF